MKKALSLILALLMCLSLCACGTSESPDTPEDRAAAAVRGQLLVKTLLEYSFEGAPKITTFVNEIEPEYDEECDTKYEVTGKVFIMDKYGDSYCAKYDAYVLYDSTLDEYDVSKCELKSDFTYISYEYVKDAPF